MALSKQDVKDIIREWACDDLLSWQSNVEEAFVDMANAVFHDPAVSDDTRNACQKVYQTFISKPQNQ